MNIKPVYEKDVKILFDMVKNCSYVLKNPEYNKKANVTELEVSMKDTTVNAYAMCLEYDPERNTEKYLINILGGFCNAMQLAAISMAIYDHDKDISKFRDILRWICKKALEKGTFSFSNISDGIEELKIKFSSNIYKESKSYLSGALIYVLGHELGHIALSHVVRDERDDNTISRNNERSADLFAFSVSDTTPFSRYAILGGLVSTITFAWFDEGYPVESESTHPYARERVYNHVTSNREYLASIGITMNNIDMFLPPVTK